MVTINTEPVEERKDRTINIDATKVYYEIDAHTSKFVAGKGMPVRQENSTASDSHANLDGDIIKRLVDYRDAKLRNVLEGFMSENDEIISADNTVTQSGGYSYILSFPLDFKDALLRPLATFIHKYLVWGTLFDWYTQLGLNDEAVMYGRQLEDIENEIERIVNTAGYEKIPLQPFGPAYKI